MIFLGSEGGIDNIRVIVGIPKCNVELECGKIGWEVRRDIGHGYETPSSATCNDPILSDGDDH